jgi:hypothetical protein
VKSEGKSEFSGLAAHETSGRSVNYPLAEFLPSRLSHSTVTLSALLLYESGRSLKDRKGGLIFVLFKPVCLRNVSRFWLLLRVSGANCTA